MSRPPNSTTPAESSQAFGEILRHPAERGERLPQCVVLYSCCCCCCCCLHTLGAAIGAAGAGNFPVEPEEYDAAAVHVDWLGPRRYPSCQGIYWSSLLYAVCISALVMFAYSLIARQQSMGARAVAEAIEEGPIVIGLTLILLGPLWLLGAAALAAVRISLWRDLPERDAYYRQLGRITGRMVIGTGIGIAVMLAIGVLFLGVV